MALKNIPKKYETKKRFKNLTEMNRHILTEKYGKDVANRIIEETEKLKRMHQASKNKLPI